MNKIYLFLLVIAFSITSCTTSSVDKTMKDANSKMEISYENVVIKDGIASPRKEMRAKLGGQTLTINYGSPSVKGREILGSLVAYDKVWRMGANEATTFETSTKLKIQGKKLAAGKYGLFTIPAKNGKWTVIFNSVADQWGAYDYSDSKDVLRVTSTSVPTKTSSETLDFVMEGPILMLKWEKFSLPIQIGLQ